MNAFEQNLWRNTTTQLARKADNIGLRTKKEKQNENGKNMFRFEIYDLKGNKMAN